MTDLTHLSVSLTKHGAHKIAALLAKHDKDEILNHLVNSEPGVNIEAAQARKTLAVNNSGEVPELWNEARSRGSETLNALVLVAIIFSHHRLIRAMQGSTRANSFSGTIERGKLLDGKEFTNFAHILEELGYSTSHSVDAVSFDLHRVFEIEKLNELVANLLKLKLAYAGWDAKNSIDDEAARLGFHTVFGVSEAGFRSWLTGGTLTLETLLDAKTERYFADCSTGEGASREFQFSSGHTLKKTGTVPVNQRSEFGQADLLHNEIQNQLYVQLADQYGAENVGTEVDTGQGTSIDIVVRCDGQHWFYEIKTGPTARACIRQAFAQLMEYAYWHGRNDRAERLIVVAPHAITKEAADYLSFLKAHFGIPIEYERFVSVRPPSS